RRLYTQHARERFLDVIRTLHRAVHERRARLVGRIRDDALALDVHLLLRVGAVRAFDDARRAREHAGCVALLDHDLLEDLLARLHVEQWSRSEAHTSAL